MAFCHKPRALDQWFWSVVNPILDDDRCWEWPKAQTRGGYGHFTCIINGKRVCLRANRAAWLFTYDYLPATLHVLHHCDNTKCTRPSHLWLGTNAENMEDKIRKGRAGYGRRSRDLQGRWSLMHAACLQCGTTTSPHKSHGLCAACVVWIRRRKNGRTPKPRKRIITK